MKIKVGLDIGGSTTKIVGMKDGSIIAREIVRAADPDAAYRVAIAVEDDVTTMDWRVAVRGGGVVGDVGHQLVAGVVVRVEPSVRVCGEVGELLARGDEVGAVGGSVAGPGRRGRPDGVERDDVVLLRGEVRDGRAVGVGRRAAHRPPPAAEGEAGPREGVGRESLRLVVGEALVGHRAGAAVGVEVDGVGDGRPVRGVGAFAVGVVGDADGVREPAQAGA